MTPTENIQQAIDSLRTAWEALRAADNPVDKYAANKIGIEIIRLQQIIDFIP